MTRLAQLTFALLVCATFAAFFVTQRLKRSPLVVRQRTVTSVFSPNGDGRRDTASIRVEIKRADDVTLSILDSEDRVVRRLAVDRREPGRRPIQFTWNGRDAAHRVVPDGTYRVRVSLRHEGRSATLRATIEVDTTPPRPTVTITAPGGRGPALIPAPGVSAVTVRTDGALYARPRFQLYRTDRGEPQLVLQFYGDAATGIGRWNGRLHGRSAPPGTYLVAVRTIDRVSNLGVSPPFGPAPKGARSGRPGITVRPLAVQTQLAAVRAGAAMQVSVDARVSGGRYTWRVLRPGARTPVAQGRGSRPLLRLPAPRGASGVDVLEVRSGAYRARAPIVVAAPVHRPVLLVLPAATWQGRNPADEDGDGLPDTLDRGGPAAAARPFAGDGLPPGFAHGEAPLLAYLDRSRLRYDITTDLALAQSQGPALAAHRGVVLAGDERWLPGRLGDALNGYVRQGGRVLSLGTESLARSVRIDAGGRLVAPTAPAAPDALGARIEGLTRLTGGTLVVKTDRLGLFAATGGLLSGFRRAEALGSLETGAQRLAEAGPPEGKPVIAAYRLGKGLVIRGGVPDWRAHLADDPAVDAVTNRAWKLLSR
jgi:hypothetical protein